MGQTYGGHFVFTSYDLPRRSNHIFVKHILIQWFNTYKIIYYKAVLAINLWILVFEGVLLAAILNSVKKGTLPMVKSGANLFWSYWDLITLVYAKKWLLIRISGSHAFFTGLYCVKSDCEQKSDLPLVWVGMWDHDIFASSIITHIYIYFMHSWM